MSEGLYLYGSLSAREMKSQKFDARTNGCLQELISIIDLDQMNACYSGDFKPHITPCLSGALLVELISPNIVWSPPGETHACKMVLVSVMGRNTRAGSDLVGSAIVSSTHNTIYRQHTAPPALHTGGLLMTSTEFETRLKMQNV